MVRAVAEDRRFHAFAGVAGVYADNAKTMAAMGDAYQAKIDRGRAAERKWRETGETETIPAVAPEGGDVAMPSGRHTSSTGHRAAKCPTTSTATRLQSLAHILPFDARGGADAITGPVLIVHPER